MSRWIAILLMILASWQFDHEKHVLAFFMMAAAGVWALLAIADEIEKDRG